MQVVQAPDPKLKIVTKPVKKVTPALLQVTKEMVKLTKTFTDPEGVGLASTQVGLTEKFFVAKDVSEKNSDKFICVFNPKIISTSKKTKKYMEGCLSIPNYWGEIDRYIGIKVSYLDETGQSITKSLRGTSAWIFQHEIDHLQGVLFTQRVLEQGGKLYKVTGRDKTGADIFEEVTL